MRGVFRMNSPLIDRLGWGKNSLFGCVLRRMMNVFFRSVRWRDNTDRAPERNHQCRNNTAHMPNS